MNSVNDNSVNDKVINYMLNKFNLYQISHPTISHLWLSYLGLKKKNYDENTIKQCFHVLKLLESGQQDLKEKDIVSLLMYKNVML